MIQALIDEELHILQNENDRLRAEIRRLREWVPCTERLPDRSESTLVAFDNGVTGEEVFDAAQNWWDMDGYREHWQITHWLPLPESPKAVDSESALQGPERCP